MTTAQRSRFRLAAMRAAFFTLFTMCCLAGLARAQAPIIDGNGTDLIAFAAAIGANGCAIDRADPRDDLVVADLKIDPCATLEDTDGDGVNDYYVNGKDIRRFVTVYDRANDDLYILFRTEGVIGDVDGNGDPDNSLCVPPSTVVDQVGIGSEDTYEVRYDVNCDGESDIIVRIENNQVTVVGAAAGSTDFAFVGNDLEVVVRDVEIPLVFTTFAFAGAIRDGLGEDVTQTTQCGTVSPDINLTKSVTPTVLCPGQNADFTLLVENIGDVDLTGVTVVDDLPAGLAFVSTVSNTCGGAVSQVGNQVTYGPFDLARGASCTIVLRASRAADCAGERTNHASVIGTFQSPCIDNGEPITISDNASATVLCGDLTCAIVAPDLDACAGETVEICGPEGNFSWAWSNGATARCITVGPGTYSLVITDLGSGCVSSNPCTVTIEELACGANCPRTVGFWGAQCAQRGNGSTKFTAAQMTQIAECIDDRSAFFNWAAGTDLDRLCRTINPTRPMQQRKQAKRQFAGVLANLCATSLGLAPSRGGAVSLDPSTPIQCPGLEADTIGELIAEVDAILAQLEGQELNDPAVKSRYGQLIGCLDAINNGANIPTSPDCEAGETESDESGPIGLDGAGSLHRAVPNPFTGSMSYAWDVVGEDQPVDIGVYDVAGRRVKSLVRSALPAGRHVVTWNGRDEDGARVPRGVYFIRARLGGESRQHRVIFLGR